MSILKRSTRLLTAIMLMGLWSAYIPITNTYAQTVVTYYVDIATDTSFSYPPPTTACVDNQPDDNCSLRQALWQADIHGGNSIIRFIIPSTLNDSRYNYDGATWTIIPTTELPHIKTNNNQIIGSTIDGFVPRIVIDGNNISTTGFTINNASGNIIKNLAIINFKAIPNSLGAGNGIRIMGANATKNEILGCYLGADPRGGTIKAAGNQLAGILVSDSASENRIGFQITTVLTGTIPIIIPNYISGNGTATNQADGILLNGSSGTVIIGNNIGIIKNSLTTNAPLPNAGNGIHLNNSNGNVIGGASAESRNIISSNGGAGILIEGGSNGNNIYANYIGVDKLGGLPMPNVSHGIHIFDGAHDNRMVGFTNSPLLISGNGSGENGGYGVLISGQDSNNNTLQGAYIGVNESGTSAIPNQSGGVRVQNNASNNNIGTAEIPNIISGNRGYGISIGQENAGNIQLDNTGVKNNIIGLSANTITPIPNRDGGVSVGLSARFTTIGGSAAERNIIASNGTANVTSPIPGGIVINSNVIGTTIQGNIIGMRRSVSNGAFNTASGNEGDGIFVDSLADTVTIGGDATTKNTIARNVGDGIQVNVGASNITISANDVTTNTLHGINLTGVTAPVITDNKVNANGPSTPSTGILVSLSPNAQILRNTANSNTQNGIDVSSSNNLLLNDTIANQNTLNGILITNVVSSTLLGNHVSSNKTNGLYLSTSDAAKITSTNTSLNLFNGLLVGMSTRVSISGTTAITNTLDGISLLDTAPFTATNNLTIRANTGAGFRASGAFQHSQIRNNNVLANKGNGIVLQGPTSGLTQHITMTNNLVEANTGSGLLIDGALKDVLVQKNKFYSNSVNGVQLGGALTPHPQQIKLDENSFTANGIPANTANPVPSSLYGLGIVLNPETRAAGNENNPNHDIDPPIESSLIAWDNGQFTGQVLTGSSPDACLPTPPNPIPNPAPNPEPTCKLQFFSTNAQRLDGQGFALLKKVDVTGSGNFTTTLGMVPKQLAVTATDMYSNTSEFALYNANPSLLIDAAQAKQARPGETVTFVHTITNNGNVGFRNVGLGFDATKNSIRLTKWDVSATPASLSLAPGETKTVTITVKLPLGPDDQVTAGTVGNVRLVAISSNTANAAVEVQVLDTLTVLPRVVLDVQPTTQSGSGRPNDDVTYLHTVTNNGNVEATVALSYNTLVAGGTAPTWTTIIEPASMTLQPGQSLGFTVKVTVSSTAQLGTEAQTIVKLTPSTSAGVDLTQEKTITDTTRTTLEAAATLVPPSQELPGAAAEVTSFQHCATNISNGEATFRIQAVSSQGSTVSFSDNDPLVNLVNGNSFTIAQGANFCFFVNVNVDRRLLPGQKDVITVVLQDAQGGSIGGASAQDTINIQRGVLYPRLYLPLILR